LIATVLDFHQIKESLLKAGIVKLHQYGSSAFEDEDTFLEKLMSKIGERDGKWFTKRNPQIDVLSSLMLDWYVATTLSDNNSPELCFSYPSNDRLSFFVKANINFLHIGPIFNKGRSIEEDIRMTTKKTVSNYMHRVSEPSGDLAASFGLREPDYYIEAVDIKGIRISKTRPFHLAQKIDPKLDMRLISS